MRLLTFGFILNPMDELNDLWAKMMQEAMFKAQSSGRTDIAEYLALKSANDEIRSTSSRWLFDSFISLSEEANRRGINLEIENAQAPPLRVHRVHVQHLVEVAIVDAAVVADA